MSVKLSGIIVKYVQNFVLRNVEIYALSVEQGRAKFVANVYLMSTEQYAFNVVKSLVKEDVENLSLMVGSVMNVDNLCVSAVKNIEQTILGDSVIYAWITEKGNVKYARIILTY